MWRFLTAVVVALGLCAMPGAASAVDLVNPDGTRAEPFQSWADNAAIVSPNAKLRVFRNTDGCPPNSGGCLVANGTFVSDLHVSSGPSPAGWEQWTFYHELGHAFDLYQLTWPERHRLKVALGFARTVRWTQPAVDGPMEYFADAYAYLAMYGGCGGWLSAPFPQYGYSYQPTCKSLRVVRKIVRAAA